MKILHVITSLLTGGAEHLMVDLLPRLRDRGHHVELCVFYGKRTDFYRQLEEAGIKIHALNDKPVFYHPRYIPALRKLMKGFDIVHTHNTAPQLFAAIGKPPGVRLITTEHSTSNRRRHIAWLKVVDRWMYRQYDHVICISDAAKTNLCLYLGGSFHKVSTIYNGIDVRRFAEASPAEDMAAKYPGLHLGAMVAAFRPEKDQETLLRAYSLLPDDYHLLLVGDGERRVKLEVLAKELLLTQRVHFLGVRTDVPAILKSVDLIILSSHYEGLSLSSIEGMACGKPFIASDVDGLREIVDGFGVSVPHGDARALAETIRELTCRPELARKVADRCRLRAMQYDISKMVAGYDKVYRHMPSESEES